MKITKARHAAEEGLIVSHDEVNGDFGIYRIHHPFPSVIRGHRGRQRKTFFVR